MAIGKLLIVQICKNKLRHSVPRFVMDKQDFIVKIYLFHELKARGGHSPVAE